ncbi:MAG: shikimate kinase [Planctomycetota bacterium]
MMNIVLVGYRGTGKSVVARQLAESVGQKVVSLDEEIERQEGCGIPEIVERRGWNGFRDVEEQVVRKYAAADHQILDCGGGVIEREANMDVLRRAGTVVWLRASTATIVQRISGNTQRPSLTGDKSFTQEVAEVLERRTPLYRRIAHIEVDTDDRAIEQVAAEILKQVQP